MTTTMTHNSKRVLVKLSKNQYEGYNPSKRLYKERSTYFIGSSKDFVCIHTKSLLEVYRNSYIYK